MFQSLPSFAGISSGFDCPEGSLRSGPSASAVPLPCTSAATAHTCVCTHAYVCTTHRGTHDAAC